MMKSRLDLSGRHGRCYWGKRATAMVAMLAVVATSVQSVLVSKTPEVAVAAVEGQKIISLSAIEELKEYVKTSEDQTFTIVEVVPVLGSGTMGYLVPGQEPLTYYQDGQVVSFVEALAIDQKVGQASREEAAKSVLSKLNSLGVLELDNSCALVSASYGEYIQGIAKDVPVEAILVKLVDESGKERTEEVTLDQGSFEFKANKTGDFIIESSNVQYVADGTGTYKQEVSYFLYENPAGESVFYYKPTFELIDFSQLGDAEDINSGLYAGKAVYEKHAVGGRYDYLGSLGVDDFTLEIEPDMEYYWVTDFGIPSDVDDYSEDTYMAVGDFVPKSDDEAGYFTADSVYVYVGADQGNYSYNAEATGTAQVVVQYSEVYMNIGFTNNNWFRQYVLDDDTAEFASEFNIEVAEVLPSGLTSAMIEDADLLVFSAGFSLSANQASDTLVHLYDKGNDVSEAIKNQIVGSIQDDGYKTLETPIMVDGNLQGNLGSGSQGNTASYLEEVVNEVAKVLMLTNDITVTTTTTGGRNPVVTETINYNYDNLNTYGAAAGGLYYVAQGGALATRGLAEEIVAGADYYSEVAATIAYENFLRLTTGVATIEGTAGQVNVGTAIRHILTVGNQISATQKEEIRVLEIQPANSVTTKSSDSDQDIVTTTKMRTWFSGITDATKITIDQMSTAEFIGKIDDITEVYDVIYIGGDFGNLNTTGSGTNQIVNYNDNAMDGLFYTNIGDTYTLSGNYIFTGLLNSDYATNSRGEGILIKDTYDSYYALYNDIETTYRFSGNDISTGKLAELNTFVKTGLPVIISDRLVDTKNTASVYGDDEIRIDRVDKASYMYEFLRAAIDAPNVFSASEAVANAGLANQYLNLSKPEIVFQEDASGKVTGTPTEYTGESNLSASLVADKTVTYTFAITNATDPTPEDTTYGVSLYIDQDADGRHEENEKISELEVRDSSGNVIAEDALKVGVTYTVKKELPSTYQGSIPWKLEVSIVGREEFHTSETGYTYIKPDEMITINILQIHETNTNIIPQNGYYAEYIGDMYEEGVYNLNVRGITITNLNNNNNALSYVDSNGNLRTMSGGYTSSDIYENCLDNYDMLVLGFGDGYGKTYDNGGLNAAAASAITRFIDSGKAVLFAHDTTSTNNVPAMPNDWTYPTSDGVEAGEVTVEKTGYTYMVWQESKNQYPLVKTPVWSIISNRWEDANGFTPVQITYPNYAGEVYNFEEQKWGYWVAPEGSETTKSSYDYSGAYGSGVTLAYWDATRGDAGEWGYYAWVSDAMTWYSVSNQPDEDVCYIYEKGAWGWYKISQGTGGKVSDAIEWVETGTQNYNSSNNNSNRYDYTPVWYNNSSSWYYLGDWEYGWWSSSYSYASKLTNKTNNSPNTVYNYEDESWGYWMAVEDSYVGSKVTNYTSIPTSAKPYYDDENDQWGYYYWSGSSKSQYYFTTPQKQPSEDVHYIYYKNAWGWYEINVPTTEVKPLVKTAYTYTTTTIVTGYTGTYSVTWPTSYYFNTILRDAIGLDRYGITNPDYNTNYMYPYNMEVDSTGESVLAQDESLVANAYKYQYDDVTAGILAGAEITEADKEVLLDAGYSIAYKPTTDDTWEYAEETQGYATGDMAGRGTTGQMAPVQDSYTFGERVSSVSQVNQGQITSYPYNVNTSEFDDASSYGQFFSVAETHHQYYQLNMNAEDVVVWYCLAGSIYDDYPNDASNFYYIYNAGNVTYTGAGHGDAGSATISVAREEAKLFINTMIAAYRAGRVEPEIAFVDGAGMNLESIYFTAEAASTASGTDTLLVQSGVAGQEEKVAFEIADTNLENPDARTIVLKYINREGKEIEIPKSSIVIYDSNNAIVTNSTLLGNTPYRLSIPKEILDELAITSVTQVTVKLSVTTKFADGEELSSADTAVALYKLGLQNLN